MESIKVFNKKKKVNWEYDEEADVLYLTFGPPKNAIGIDVGQGMIVRYDESNKEIVGLTAYGLGHGLLRALEKGKN
ncbi:MAG: DUF2283 domain-containing protein [bacterium]